MTIYKLYGNQLVLSLLRLSENLKPDSIEHLTGLTDGGGLGRSENIYIDCEWRLILGMGKETIIFFEQLGFGWVLDNIMLNEIKLTNFNDNCITDTSLIKIIENILTEYPTY